MPESVPDASEEAQYDNLARSVQNAVDALAQHDPAEVEDHGAKARIARDHDVKASTVRYAADRYDHLVAWRRKQFRGPLHPEAAQPAVEADMAEAVADGAGGVSVNVRMSLTDTYRALKALPEDLSTRVFFQTAAQVDMSYDELVTMYERNTGD